MRRLDVRVPGDTQVLRIVLVAHQHEHVAFATGVSQPVANSARPGNIARRASASISVLNV
jgi:hypothetical protein